MTVEFPAFEEVRERVLLDPRRALVGEQLVVAEGVEEARGHDQPAEAQRGRERLAGRAGIEHAVGLEALERADGRAVVAVLGVVVVLDRERVVLAQEGQQRGAALGSEHGTGRMLVGGGDEYRVDIREAVDPEPVVIDGAGAVRGPPRPISYGSGSRILDRDPARAGGGERVTDEPEPLVKAVGDDDCRGLGDDTAHAPEIVGERTAQDVVTAGVAVAEIGVAERRERLAVRAQPGAAREGADVRDAGAEVVARRQRRWRHNGGRRRGGGGVRHARACALAQAEVALGRELRVGLDGEPPRDAELAGEVARGRHARAGAQRALADRTPELLFDLRPERMRAVAGDREQKIYGLTGTSKASNWAWYCTSGA